MKMAKARRWKRFVQFYCPACETIKNIPVEGDNAWGFNDNLDAPTLTPSILEHPTLYGPDKLPFSKYNGPPACETTKGCCHSFVTDGKIQYLSDCTHALAGQTVDLPEIKESSKDIPDLEY